MKQNLKNLFEVETKKVDEWLDKLLPPEDVEPVSIHKSMRYSMFAGGKRLRPVLCLLAYEVCGGDGDSAYPAACALEMMHTFSLIHDDLPCMDDDDFRRGKPTNHKAFGEAIAVLAGDALCIHAYGILGGYADSPIVKEISNALGTAGMIGGQVVDIESEGKKDIDVSTLEFIHIHKTEKLITTSLRTGALIAEADSAKLRAITKYGQGIGLAFQIVDDILDITSDTATLGKDVGSDIANNKATYPRLFGLEKSRIEARRLVDEAKNALEIFGEKGAMLRDLADFIVERVN
jgi:geranylgeranyl diphosphate synthase type II